MLSQDDRLSLDIAYLFGDDPFLHLLENGQLLLDNLDLYRLTRCINFLNYDRLSVRGTVEVVLAVEVIEALECRDVQLLKETDSLPRACNNDRGIARPQGFLAPHRIIPVVGLEDAAEVIARVTHVDGFVSVFCDQQDGDERCQVNCNEVFESIAILKLVESLHGSRSISVGSAGTVLMEAVVAEALLERRSTSIEPPRFSAASSEADIS
ncbi:hypothetical protein B0H11DRAFT_2405613 [Mycena galericulata]|nr:hypothetical protein B0H11DRAFT_2405613 [Mycena galericulata]